MQNLNQKQQEELEQHLMTYHQVVKANIQIGDKILEKHLIFIGGEAGVGKSVSARELQKKLSCSIVIDKDESTSILANALLRSYNQPESDRESDIYLKEVKPLEYKQLDSIVWDGIENTSMIVTAPFFDSFLDNKWLEA